MLGSLLLLDGMASSANRLQSVTELSNLDRLVYPGVYKAFVDVMANLGFCTQGLGGPQGPHTNVDYHCLPGRRW